MGKSSKSNHDLKDTKHEDLMKELRTHTRELREIRKALKEMVEIFKCMEADRREAELPEWTRIVLGGDSIMDVEG